MACLLFCLVNNVTQMEINIYRKINICGRCFYGVFCHNESIAAISIFLALTSHETEAEAKIIAAQATLTAFIIVVIFSLAGHFLLLLFGVSFTALRLTGGILVGIIVMRCFRADSQMLANRHKTPYKKPLKEEGSVAITPLGIPLLAGPGVIITAMNFSTGGILNCLLTIIAFGILCILTYYVLISGKKIRK